MPEEVLPQMMPSPPVARREPTTTTLHGQSLHDDYAWLRNKDSQEVTRYLEAENAYAEAWMADTKDLQETLYREMLSHIKETDESYPYHYAGYYYYSRTVEGSQYTIYCRRKGSMEAAEQIILDGNELAKDHPFMALGAFAISEDQNLLAYSVDHTGFRQYTLHIKDLRTGETLPDTAERVGSIVWANDNMTSSTPSKTKRPSASTGSIATPSASRSRRIRWSSRSPTSASTSAPARPAISSSSCSTSAATPPAKRTSCPHPSPPLRGR